MSSKIGRRSFMKSAAAAAAGFTIVKPGSVFGTPANSTVQLGIIGCGGRGTHVATSMMNNTTTQVVAIADLFNDRLEAGRDNFNKLNREKNFPEIKASNLYKGSKGYLRLLESRDVDAVLIATPPFLHPEHLLATVDAGKHVYCEKPVGVDVHGCKQVMWAGRKADGKLSLAVGFQIRHATPYVELVKRVHAGDIGDIITAQCYYFAGSIKLQPIPGAGRDEMRLRHWVHDRELSGDILVEQGIHVVDICVWMMGGHPLTAVGAGGGKGKLHGGTCYSHYALTYTFPGDVHVTFQSTQVDPGYGDVAEKVMGTKGIAEAHYTGGVFIRGENEWDSGAARAGQKISDEDWAKGAFRSALDDADPNKQKAFIESIKTGNYLNQADAGAESALSAILGRTAAYTGEIVTWDEMLTSDEKWDPMVDLTQFD